MSVLGCGEVNTVAFATWNINLSSGGYAKDKLEVLRRLRHEGVEIIALQEIRPEALESLRQLKVAGGFRHVIARLSSATLKPKCCAILATEAFRARSGVLPQASPPYEDQDHYRPGVPMPHRAVWATLRHRDGYAITAASFHLAQGSQERESWEVGRHAKRQNFRGIAHWLAARKSGLLAGLDANAPLRDAFCETHGPLCPCENRYFPARLLAPARGRDRFDPHAEPRNRHNPCFDQEEHLLFDPVGADAKTPGSFLHTARDALRVYLDQHPTDAGKVLTHFRQSERDQPHEGYLALSHINRNSRAEDHRRFDYIIATPDIRPLTLDYRFDVGVAAHSDHAVVVGTFELADRGSSKQHHTPTHGLILEDRQAGRTPPSR